MERRLKHRKKSLARSLWMCIQIGAGRANYWIKTPFRILMSQNYYAVKFNAEGTESIDYQDFVYTNPNYDPKRKGRNSQHLFAHAMKINAYPSIVFFDEKGNLIQPLPGYKTPQQLELFLKMIESDDYLEITTAEAWEEYQSNFESTFKS